MSDEINNENNEDILAVLSEGESVIPAEKVEEYKAAVEEVLETAKIEEAVAPKEDDNVITGPKGSSKEKPALVSVENGVIGSGTTKASKPKAAPAPEVDTKATVALFSTRNVSWPGVGKVSKGYNIVSVEASEQWLKRNHTRLATPEEVAKEYGN